jgi:glycosyl hydrolase family 6
MRKRLTAIAFAALLISVAVTAGSAVSSGARPHAALAQKCRDPFPRSRNASNPLMLPRAPGSNPLVGAHFFTPGPAHGAAAQEIVQLLGGDPARYLSTESWTQFKDDLDHGALHRQLVGHPVLSYTVNLLEKIAQQPEPQRFSLYSAGGGPGAIFSQVQKIFCGNITADPGSIPLITTFLLYQTGFGSKGYCETTKQILANRPNFQRQVNEMAAGIENRPAVAFLELDAIGASRCMEQNGALGEWEANMRYEIRKVSSLPHTVVYIEGGYSDGNDPQYTAMVLKAVQMPRLRGFFTNDTHINWPINEVRWGEQVSRLMGGMPFVINTADSGQGPKLNPHPVTQGNEDLCNPPGRGIGIRTTTNTGFPNLDAFLWMHPPGNSSGPCNGGTPSGTFWLHRALEESGNADARLGPSYPNSPY